MTSDTAIDTLKQTEETGTVAMFIVGHGFNDGSNYRSADQRGMGRRRLARLDVPWQILQEAVEVAEGRRILFIDTCPSASPPCARCSR